MTNKDILLMKSNLLLSLLLFVFVHPSFAQQSNPMVKNALFGSIHFGNNSDNDAFTKYEFAPGVAVEYRKQIDSLSKNIYLTFGVSLESIPQKDVRENNDFFMQTHYNFTMPLGIYYHFYRSYYAGLYASLDIPFARKENSEFGGDVYRNAEFDFRYLNINFSAGLNIGKMVTISDRTFMIELHFKALGILGLKSNDYWHYPEGGIPYYTGIRLGYGF